MNNFETWIVYDHPFDYPDSYVAKQFINQIETERFILSSKLEGVVETLLERGFTCQKTVKDDNEIIQVWIKGGGLN